MICICDLALCVRKFFPPKFFRLNFGASVRKFFRTKFFRVTVCISMAIQNYPSTCPCTHMLENYVENNFCRKTILRLSETMNMKMKMHIEKYACIEKIFARWNIPVASLLHRLLMSNDTWIYYKMGCTVY